MKSKPNIKTEIDDQMLQSMINKTQYHYETIEPKEQEFWFSFPNQKQLCFDVASGLLIQNDMEPLEAIKLSKDFIDCFYQEVIAPNSWKRN